MRNDVRASDAERDTVTVQLREHFVQGRLTLEELKGRLDAALAVLIVVMAAWLVAAAWFSQRGYAYNYGGHPFGPGG